MSSFDSSNYTNVIYNNIANINLDAAAAPIMIEEEQNIMANALQRSSSGGGDEAVSKVTIQCKEIQMSKLQDFAVSGETIDLVTGEPIKWAGVFDGHGSNEVITFLRAIEQDRWAVIMARPCPGRYLWNIINDSVPLYGMKNSGSTMCVTKLFHDHAEIIIVGDSQAAVYKNGELVLFTEAHYHENLAEVHRLKQHDPNIRFVDSTSIRVESATRIVNCRSKYTLYPSGKTLAPTQALGHGGATGCEPTHYVVTFEKTDELKVLMASDGVWDMMMDNCPDEMREIGQLDADGLTRKAYDRWLQPWEMVDTITKPDFVYKGVRYTKAQGDDISVAMIQRTYGSP
jgi:serine/threonine protein phosphatase PrpC